MPWILLLRTVAALAALSAMGTILCHALVWFVLRRKRLATTTAVAAAPAEGKEHGVRVSVLRPLCGMDAALEDNLEALARQTHHDLELILGAADPQDPALALARSFAERHPELRCRIEVGQIETINPKVALLERMSQRATGDWLVVSDSNVRVAPDYVQNALSSGGSRVGLVTHLVAGVGGSSLAAHCENLQLNCLIAPGVCGVRFLAGRTCVIGKSMFLRREALEAIGGFRAAGRYLAEDYAIGRKVEAAGYHVVTVPPPVPAWHEGWTLRKFLNRHLRWAVMRRQVSRTAYSAELLLSPTPLLALYFIVATCLPTATVSPWGLTLGLSTTQAASFLTYRCMTGSFPGATSVLLNPLRECASSLLWIAGWFVQRIEWRGKAYLVHRDSLLTPAAQAMEGVFDEA